MIDEAADEGGDEATAMRRGSRRSDGNALRAAVLGANDGLLSNFSLVMGMSGAVAGTPAVVIAGIAGLVAGAFSMALGEWLSVTNARELYSSQIRAQRLAIDRNPDDQRRQLARVYREKGLSASDADGLAARFFDNEELAVDTMVREVLGIDPVGLGGSPLTAAATSFGLFSFGAAIPLIPLLVDHGRSGFLFSVLASAIGLLAFGAASAHVTQRKLVRGALRQLVVGGLAAGATYMIGKVVGHAIGG